MKILFDAAQHKRAVDKIDSRMAHNNRILDQTPPGSHERKKLTVVDDLRQFKVLCSRSIAWSNYQKAISELKHLGMAK